MMKSFIISLATKLTIPVFLQSCASCPYISTHHNNFSFIPLFLKNAHPSHTHSPNPSSSLLQHHPTHDVPVFLPSFCSSSTNRTRTTLVLGKLQYLHKLSNQEGGAAELSFPYGGDSFWRGMEQAVPLPGRPLPGQPCCHPRLSCYRGAAGPRCFQTVGRKVCKVFRLSVS